MKVEAECAPCIVSKGFAEVLEATVNPALRFRAMSELLRLLTKEFKPTAVPAELETKRDRLIKKITGNDDPYRRSKRVSNDKAMKLLPLAKEIVNGGYTQQDRFKRACVCAIVGNAIELNAPTRTPTSADLKRLLKNSLKDLVIDDTSKIYELASKLRTVLYLTDNAGEIVFDTLLVEQLKNMGLDVTVGVKGGPVVDDATLEDAEASGIGRIADKVITTGTDAIGLPMEELPKEFLEVYEAVDVVFAKGMGHAETLTEYKLRKPHALLFKVKCNPVANFFTVAKGKNVAMLVPRGYA